MYTVRLELLGRLRPFRAGRRARDLVLDAALVLAADDAEEALLAPVGVPRVGDLPVLLAVLDAPADDLDRVAARRRAGGVLVDAALCRVSGASLGAAARRAQEQPVAQGAATRGAAVAAVQVKGRGTGRTA